MLINLISGGLSSYFSLPSRFPEKRPDRRLLLCTLSSLHSSYPPGEKRVTASKKSGPSTCFCKPQVVTMLDLGKRVLS